MRTPDRGLIPTPLFVITGNVEDDSMRITTQRRRNQWNRYHESTKGIASRIRNAHSPRREEQVKTYFASEQWRQIKAKHRRKSMEKFICKMQLKIISGQSLTEKEAGKVALYSCRLIEKA